MQRSGFTTIEMVIVVVLIGLIAAIGFPKIRQSLDKANVRSARAAVGTLAATARAAAIQRGCPGVIHFLATVWVTTNCPTKVDTVSGVQQLGTRFKVTLVATRDSVRYDPRGLSLDNLTTNTVVRLAGSVGSNLDSTVINPLGKVVH